MARPTVIRGTRKLKKASTVYVPPSKPVVIKPQRKKLNVPTKLKKYIKMMIAQNIETKEATPVYASNVDVLPYGVATTHSFTTLNLNQIWQGIAQGTGNGQRIGDEIKVRKLTFKGFINWDSSKIDVVGYRHIPVYVKMFVFRRQDSLDNPATYAGPAGLGENQLLMNGPTAIAPSNDLVDFNKPFNRDTYRIFKTKTFKLGPAAVGDTPNTSGQWNNDFKFSQRFSIDLSKHVNRIKFNEGQNYQQNQAMYVGFLLAFGNNASMDSGNKPPVEIHYTTNMTYEDA